MNRPRRLGIVGMLTALAASLLVAAPAPAQGTPSAAVRATPAVSADAPLPRDAYRGLACDPFDRRLRGVALPNGVGPEARVAAACLRREWRARATASAPEVTVHASPSFPARWRKRLATGVRAGHRLFGRYADVTSYEVLASADPQFSCRTGAQLVDPRLTGGGWIRAWESAWNSGCPDTDYSAGGWTSTILGEGGREYLAWTLFAPADAGMLTATETLGPTWFFAAVSHEFAHSIQMQRSLGSRNGQESMGRWFAEGQAQYLGNTAAAYTIGPADIRRAQLAQLRRVMREEGVTRIDVASMESDWRTNLVYPAGYFAYEWLVAHYGLAATFEWWNTWNTDCERPGSGVCWRASAQELFGMSDAQLIVALNRYVNRQVRRR